VNKDDMILISVDHTVEPPDMFKDHLPQKYIDDAPRLVHNADGSDTWQFRDTVIPHVARQIRFVVRRVRSQRESANRQQGLKRYRNATAPVAVASAARADQTSAQAYLVWVE
jgi:hypothetical protein